MKSAEYRRLVRTVVRNSVHKKFPGLRKKEVNELATDISVAVHARFYGAAVDDVASPIWRDDGKYALAFSDAHPTKTAQELLDDQ